MYIYVYIYIYIYIKASHTCSKSPDMPIDSSSELGSTPNRAAVASRQSARLVKHDLSPGAPMVISPASRRFGQPATTEAASSGTSPSAIPLLVPSHGDVSTYSNN